MSRVFQVVRWARPGAWVAAVIVSCIFASGSERMAPTGHPKRESAADLVSTTVHAEAPDVSGTQAVALVMTIAPNWHVYANPAGSDEFKDSQTTLTFSAGGRALKAKVDYPPGTPSAAGPFRVYEGRVVINAKVKRGAGNGPMQLSIKVGVCNDKLMRCLKPTTLDVNIP